MFAPHYVEARLRLMAVDTPLRAERHAASAIVAQMSHGDAFELMDVTGDAAWGRAVASGLVGYVDASAVTRA